MKFRHTKNGAIFGLPGTHFLNYRSTDTSQTYFPVEFLELGMFLSIKNKGSRFYRVYR